MTSSRGKLCSLFKLSLRQDASRPFGKRKFKCICANWSAHTQRGCSHTSTRILYAHTHARQSLQLSNKQRPGQLLCTRQEACVAGGRRQEAGVRRHPSRLAGRQAGWQKQSIKIAPSCRSSALPPLPLPPQGPAPPATSAAAD